MCVCVCVCVCETSSNGHLVSRITTLLICNIYIYMCVCVWHYIPQEC